MSGDIISETPQEWIDRTAPYKCLSCGHGSFLDYYCSICDSNFWKSSLRRGYTYVWFILWPSIVLSFWFWPFHFISWPLIFFSFYLTATSKKRMKKKFTVNNSDSSLYVKEKEPWES